MRKNVQKGILDIIETLYEAHASVKELIGRIQCEEAVSLLGECQNTAVEIGGIIEASEGESFCTVHFLEDYCETVYQTAVGVNSGILGDDAKETLDKGLDTVRESVKKDIRVKLEIVFMPYKASMWDSLESVWQAADNDPDCDAYVVPIPYYDRDANGNFIEFHYEGDLFPEYVSTVHFEQYDLNDRRPDAIYIHNPYDDDNNVTSIDPRFYSYKIKQYTDCLVYVPYCVYTDPRDPYSEKTVDFFERYYEPGLIHSDKIIVQSEVFRSALLEMLNRKSDISRAQWEEKIIALGSPKYDKIMNDDYDLCYPEEWKNIIYRSDGTRKKVIFYNTSLNSFLLHSDTMLEKIKSVLNYFYQNKTDIALLWRPHPLMNSTVKSMRPELWAYYNSIVEDYKNEMWGIYDETPDPYAAIRLSDAYYGDYSSLILLYMKTNKPIMMQDAEINDYTRNLVSSAMYYDGEYLWCAAIDFNGLFRINPRNEESVFIGCFPDEDMYGYYLYVSITEYNNKLYFSPYNAKTISIYDKINNCFITLQLRNDLIHKKKKFANAEIYSKYVVFSGCSSKTILQLNTYTNEITYIDSWSMEIINKYNLKEDDYIVSHFCILSNVLYGYCHKAQIFVCVNLENESYYVGDFKCGNGHNVYIYNDSHYIWLLPYSKGNIMRFDPVNNQLSVFSEIKDSSTFLFVKKYIYVFSYNNHCLEIDKETIQANDYNVSGTIIGLCKADDDFIACNMNGNFYVFKSNPMKTVRNFKVQISDNDIFIESNKIISENMKYYDYLHENGELNLNDLVQSLNTSSKFDRENKEYEPVGKRIHNYIKDTLL